VDERLLARKMERARRFFAQPGRGKLLLQVQVPGQGQATCQLLPEHLEQDWRPYVARQTDRFSGFVAAREWLDDDWFPMFHPWFGAAELAAYLPNPVEFGAETCWTVPNVVSARDFRRPALDDSPPLLRTHLDILRFCQERAAGRYLVGLRGTYAPMEVAGAVVGSGLLYDLQDCPEAVDKLIDYASEAAVWHLEQQFGVVGMYAGGTVNGYLQLWMPGRVAAHVGNDLPCLISPRLYRRFGWEADRRVLARFDGGQMHSHNLGWHQFGNYAALPGLMMLEIAEDPKVPPTSGRLAALFEIIGELPVCLYMDVSTFRRSLPELRLGNALVRLTEDVGPAEADELLSLARGQWPDD
jgi:hypothetical protein